MAEAQLHHADHTDHANHTDHADHTGHVDHADHVDQHIDRTIDPPVATSGSTASNAPPPMESKKMERRVMPSRLRRAANLLAGSAMEDELNGMLEKDDASLALPETTPVLLSTQQIPSEPLRSLVQEQRWMVSSNTLALKREQPIETPDFRELTVSDVIGKTRALRSEEDTSDAAYERRHRKPDNVEKRQRRLERENLARDRQKLRDRLEQLKVADPRVLLEIIMARDQRQRENEQGQASPVTYSDHETNTRLEQLRNELIDEARTTLRRYDALLPEVDNSDASASSKRKKLTHADDDASGTDDLVPSRAKNGRTTRVKRTTNRGSPLTTASRLGTASSTAESTSKRASTKQRASTSHIATADTHTPVKRRASTGSQSRTSPHPFRTSDGQVRAEHTYANIHARTSGGRFAPKTALGSTGPSGSTSRINTKSGGMKRRNTQSATPSPGQASTTSQATPSSQQQPQPPVKRPRGRPRIHPRPPPKGEEEDEERKRRLKVILKRGPAGADSSSSNTSSPQNTPTAARIQRSSNLANDQISATTVKEEDANQSIALESEDEEPPQPVAHAALSLEEAQALFAQAMEDGDEDEDAKDAAAAAAAVAP